MKTSILSEDNSTNKSQIYKLRLYVNPSWRHIGYHSSLINPWWGNPIGAESVLAKQMHDTYTFDTNYYTITDVIEDADMVFAPYRHEWFRKHDATLFNECVATAEKANLPLLVDGVGDVEHDVCAKNVYILRYGGYRFKRDSRRIQIPPFADDLLERYRDGKLVTKTKQGEKPSVGFAGWAKLSTAQYLRTVIKEFPARIRSIFDMRYRACAKGVLWRQRVIKILQASSLVRLNLLIRKSFSGIPKTAQGDIRVLQEEMVNTILQSDYALDVRGDANESIRLFEILSLGRIPVIVDTERNFPFSSEVDYSSFALIVDFRDIDKLPDKIAEFHKNVSPEKFEQMQRNAREAYVNHFRIDAITPHIMRELRSELALRK